VFKFSIADYKERDRFYIKIFNIKDHSISVQRKIYINDKENKYISRHLKKVVLI